MFCPKCGANVESGTRFCSECGTDITIKPAPQPQPQPVHAYTPNTYQPQPQYTATQPAYRPAPPAPQYAPSAYQPQNNMYANDPPMSVGQYILTFIIMGIPLVGFIMLLVWSFGSSANRNKKNFARATLIYGIIIAIISIVISIAFGAVIFNMINASSRSYY